jgi:NF-X1-type zinc finger protein NFXL1
MVEKPCVCGWTKKEVPCSRVLTCERRCTIMRNCGNHACRRKCCPGSCAPCEEVCGKRLQCGNHKCSAVCHSGPCYPCPLQVEVACHCGGTVVSLPCGRERLNARPGCLLTCPRSSYCRHPQATPHPCHGGRCPQCKQPCQQARACGHSCVSTCHDEQHPEVVVLPVRGKRRASETPTAPLPPRPTPCPPCMVLMTSKCDGKHETRAVSCSMKAPYKCDRPCGRNLDCGRHPCCLGCHTVIGSCGECHAQCDRPPPPLCTHRCQLTCHADDCPPCDQLLSKPCHCGALVMRIICAEYGAALETARETMLTCKGRCPRTLSCGHQCALDCHAGPCSDPAKCKKKLVTYCPCKRIKKVLTGSI